MSQLKYLLRKILEAVPLLFGLVTLVFFLSRLLPGDATSVFLSPTIPRSVVEHLRSQFGLDKPVIEQYFLWLGSVVRGDLGYSFTHNAPVSAILRQVFPNTALLAAAALCIEAVLAIGIAGMAAAKPGSRIDRFISHSTLVVYTLPSFWIGILLLMLFSYNLQWLPSSQMHSAGSAESGSVADLLRHLILPALTVAIPGAAGLARYLRSNFNAVLRKEFVVAARSMGARESTIFRLYVLPNSISPMVSMMGIEIGLLLTGVLITETLFAWPGMGRLVVMAIFARDYPLILGCTVVAGLAVVFGNFLADMVNALIDPRIRLA